MKDTIFYFFKDYGLRLFLLIWVLGFAVASFFVLAFDKCPSCHSIVSSGNAYCDTCGYDLKNHCSECGAENSFNAKYCRSCGNDL